MTIAAPRIDQPSEALSVDVITRHIISEHDGDAVEAVRTLVQELDFARDQLHIASSLLSRGMGRGWKPSLERLPAAEASR